MLHATCRNVIKKMFFIKFQEYFEKNVFVFRAFRFQNDDIVKCLTLNSTKVCFLTGRNS